MFVRTLTADDAAAFQALRLAGLLECPSAFASSHAEEAPTPMDVVAARLVAQPGRACLGAFDDTMWGPALVGVVGLQREGMAKMQHKAFIWGLYVAPAHRAAGVGRQLISQALAYAAQTMGVRQVLLGVNAHNTAALALYEALGFVAFGREPGFMVLNGQLHDEVHMLRVLTAADGVRDGVTDRVTDARPESLP
jgi:ribosomal protein S18 acetylase RimI-like enzyme